MEMEGRALTSLAVSDAVRTSLGPKGMDKMVSLSVVVNLR
jgi:chaperonin GroEL (HSP60 family)